MRKIVLPLFALSFALFTSCSDDDVKKLVPETTLAELVDAEGNWNDEAVGKFGEKLTNSTSATGADMTKFAWTVAKGGTTLPTSLTADEVLEGEITADTSLDATKVYELKGDVYVRSGATLTIPAGTVIFADPSNNLDSGTTDIKAADVLIVNKGGKLIAEGTAADPIIFTSGAATPAAGDWGGIVMLGEAPINVTNGNAEIADNVSDDTLPYGGTNASDNSGSLKYVILAYPGTQINTDAEYNGFSFYAIGSGTKLDYLEVVQGKDDSFEWFGGTVSASNLYGNNFDDTFDWAEGFVGTLDNIVAEQPAGADHCIEADNLKANNAATPFSNPTVQNATFMSVGSDDAIKLRRGTKAQFNNIVIEIASGTKANFEIDDVQTGQNILDGETTFTNVKIDTDNAKFAGNANL
ncbi:hypothetical protein [Tenacibaculum agarivorans]|uniref:hypothetical protein n=1 Tax=Tenacibaculum agarivorans TaxID=1908389 RepID=UPI00094BC651|nr:hypothetical protein [Tenacibaculum agarivorans]